MLLARSAIGDEAPRSSADYLSICVDKIFAHQRSRVAAGIGFLLLLPNVASSCCRHGDTFQSVLARRFIYRPRLRA